MTAPVHTPAPARRRLVGLDGLRGVLSLCVILVHVTAHFSPTILAKTHVDTLGQAIVIFFVMSGFLIYYPFARAILDQKSPTADIGGYVRARIMRIFPAYLAIFIVANILGLVFVENAMVVQARGNEGGIGTITDPGALALHLSLVQNYVPSQLQTGLSSSWTLTVELAFYIALPFLAAGFFAIVRRSGRLRAMNRYVVVALPGALLIVTGLIWRIVIAALSASSGISRETSEWGPNFLAVLSRSYLPWADNFGWGMIATAIYFALMRGALDRARVLSIRRISWALLILGLIASAAAYLLFPRFIGATFAVLSFGLLLLIVLPSDGTDHVWPVATFLDNRVFHWLGVTSLSTYLVHFPVLLACEHLGITGGDSWGGWAWNFLLVSVVSVALASLSYLYIEKPALTWGTKKRAPKARA